jgi:uncharacterized protein YdeI (YjbR/CyaY-like superfamily)
LSNGSRPITPRGPRCGSRFTRRARAFRTVTPAQALDERYAPRGPRSTWSQINRENVVRLIAAGRMTPHGQRHIDAAKADGRWDAAYAPRARTTVANLPADLRAAIDANPRAKETFRTLNRQNLFALAFRTNAMKTSAGRAKKIATLVAMLARGKTILPNSPPKGPATRKRAGRAQ